MDDIFKLMNEKEEFTYVDSINYNGRNYVAYMDAEDLYISEFTIEGEDLILDDISDELYETLLKEMEL